MSSVSPILSAPPAPAPARARLGWHLLALVAVAVAVWVQFLRAPGFGDDLTYWSQAFDFHERGTASLEPRSFHDLRWPVWGVCWALQGLFGFGLFSYYGVPLIFLAAGAALAFTYALRSTQSVPIAWAAALGLLFQPLLDTVCYRPMPDAAEGVWSGLVLLAWWASMNARGRGAAVVFSLLTGLGVFLTETNRITGIFIVPVLLVATLLLFPRKFGWLVLAGFFAALFYALECGFYQGVFNDWLHNVHANMGAKGKKGTESIAFWRLPLRFFDTLWGGIGPIYCVLGAIGLWAGWQKFGTGGRLMVIWFATLYLGYSCAPQSLFPYRPLVRDADRFLSGVAIPLSVLAAFGLAALFQPLWLGRWKIGRWLATRPVLCGLAGFVLLSAITTRERFNLDYVPEMRRYMDSLPRGTKIFTHSSMRPLAFMINAAAAERFDWRTRNTILIHDSSHEAQAAECDELWYARKLLWLNTRKQMDDQKTEQQPKLASYLDHPEQEWITSRLLAKGDTPDLIFYRRRHADSPPPKILTHDAPEWQGLVPALPLTWNVATGERRATVKWRVPPELRGQFARFEMEGAANDVQAITFRLRFASAAGSSAEKEFLLKPYLYTVRGKDFFALQIPTDAETCEVQARFSGDAEQVTFTSFRAIIDPATE